MNREQQLKFEEETDSAAAAERLAKLQLEAAQGNIELPRASAYIARAFTDIAASINAVKEAKVSGNGKYKGWLRKVPTDIVALVSLREGIRMALNSGAKGKPLTVTRLCVSIGKLLELEVKIREAELVNPLYMKKINDQVRERNTQDVKHLRGVYTNAYDQVMKGNLDSSLTNAEATQLGKFGVQACIDAGVLDLHQTYGKRGNMNYLVLADEIDQFLRDYSNSDVQNVIDKQSGAMLCAPDPWSNLNDGGYISPRRKVQQPLMSLSDVRRSERARLRGEFNAEKMPLVFDAANYLQSIGMEVHAPTLQAIRQAWDEAGGTMGIPRKNPPVAPVFPFAEDWQAANAPDEELAVHVQWKRRMAEHYAKRLEWRGKVREIGGFLKVAEKHTGPIWFPVFFDKRGRWYYRGSPNPQGSDISKAVLHFAEKKPLGERGLYWLKVHIANSLGYDKERFDARVAYTDERYAELAAALDNPLDSAAVFGTDAPWCVFSAVWELRAAMLSGDPRSYCTGIVVHMDATCSGLQHFSALLRDPVGGTFVNLTDDAEAGPKQDIYARISTTALQAAQRDTASSDAAVVEHANWWLNAGIPRGMAKKPVMTYVYGATLRGTTEFVQGYVEDEMGLQWPVGKRPYDVAQYAGAKLFHGIAATVPSAEYAMQWLKGIARSQPRGKRMEWRSPSGFLVQHDYQSYDEVKVWIKSCGIERVVVREYNDDTVPLKMQNAIAPNFVHALDSAHLTLTALRMKEKNLSMVGIHDSFGTHASDVDFMHVAIREEFVGMYLRRNLLAEFLWEVDGVGESPLRGSLDLRKVLNSEFFFC
jgi:DNA-directed RNA polymerase